MDRLLTMRVFQKVADEGGFAAAARALDMSPVSVTRLVADLEEHLGTRLLQRTTRRVNLTEAGQHYLGRVREILVDVDEAFSAATANTTEMAGTLRLMASPLLAAHILAPLVTPFRALHPKVRIEIHVDNAREPPIEDHDITLLGANASFDGNVIARPIATTEAIVCAAPRYVQTHGAPQSPDELRQHLSLRLRNSNARHGVWTLIDPTQNDHKVDVEVEPVLVANHTETLLHATLNGAGISAQPVDLVAPYLCNGSLQRVLAPWITGRYTLYAAFPSRKFMPMRTRAFLEFLTTRTRADIENANLAASPAP